MSSARRGRGEVRTEHRLGHDDTRESGDGRVGASVRARMALGLDDELVEDAIEAVGAPGVVSGIRCAWSGVVATEEEGVEEAEGGDAGDLVLLLVEVHALCGAGEIGWGGGGRVVAFGVGIVGGIARVVGLELIG